MWYLSGTEWKSKPKNFKKSGIEFALGKGWIVDMDKAEFCTILLSGVEQRGRRGMRLEPV